MDIGRMDWNVMLGFCAALLAAGCAANPDLPRSTPEAQGVSSRAVLAFVQAADKIDTLHSFMILRHGRVIAEGWWQPEAADKPHVLHSVTKSFTSTAAGIAVDEGKLSLDDPVLKFFPAEAPAEASGNLKSLRVRDLLSMSGGHDVEPRPADGKPTVKAFLAHPFVHAPGTHFKYNTLGTYVASAIITRATGQTTMEYLRPRLFEPLGIENPDWPSSAEGYSIGGTSLKLKTQDIAKLGQLYLQRGMWNGRRLLSEKWIDQATSKQVENAAASHAKMGVDWRQGYGFQFWRCTHNAFRADGAAGQIVLVIPEKDVVVAITADTGAMQGELDAIWETLYPAFQARPLADDPDAQRALNDAIARLKAHPATKKPA